MYIQICSSYKYASFTNPVSDCGLMLVSKTNLSEESYMWDTKLARLLAMADASSSLVLVLNHFLPVFMGDQMAVFVDSFLSFD